MFCGKICRKSFVSQAHYQKVFGSTFWGRSCTLSLTCILVKLYSSLPSVQMREKVRLAERLNHGCQDVTRNPADDRMLVSEGQQIIFVSFARAYVTSCRHIGPILSFVRCDVPFSYNSAYWSLRSSKVNDFCVIWKATCNFLLVISTADTKISSALHSIDGNKKWSEIRRPCGVAVTSFWPWGLSIPWHHGVTWGGAPILLTRHWNIMGDWRQCRVQSKRRPQQNLFLWSHKTPLRQNY